MKRYRTADLWQTEKVRQKCYNNLYYSFMGISLFGSGNGILFTADKRIFVRNI